MCNLGSVLALVTAADFKPNNLYEIMLDLLVFAALVEFVGSFACGLYAKYMGKFLTKLLPKWIKNCISQSRPMQTRSISTISSCEDFREELLELN